MEVWAQEIGNAKTKKEKNTSTKKNRGENEAKRNGTERQAASKSELK